MFDLIFVTSRLLSSRPLVEQVAHVLDRQRVGGLPCPTRVILREKDLDDTAYAQLAQQVASLCEAAGVDFLWQSHVGAALAMREQWLCCRRVQMGMGDFLQLSQAGGHHGFDCCWVSVHGLEEAQRAAALGAAALIYGHVYETSCKAGLAPRGTRELGRILECVGVPVYAIGGISTVEQCEVLEELGCAGACVMSGYMGLG